MNKIDMNVNEIPDEGSIKKLLMVIEELDKSGVLDVLLRMLKDDSVTSSIKKLISSGFVMNTLENSDTIINSLTTLDLSLFPHYVNALKAVERAIKTEDVEPVGGITGMLHKMKDENVQKGVGIMFSLLKNLGETCSEAASCPFKE